MKAINDSAAPRPVILYVNGGAHAAGTAKVITLASADLNAENNFDKPTAVAPMVSTVAVGAEDVSVELQPYSLTAYRIPLH